VTNSRGREFDLTPLTADGWYDHILSTVPALEKLASGLGDALVALALAAGFRITSAAVDRISGEINNVEWSRDGSGDNKDPIRGSGTPQTLRTEVLAVLVGEADAEATLTNDPTVPDIRNFLGQRTILLCPLFGLTLRRLVLQNEEEFRVVVFHDDIEEIVPLRQLRRYLRTRVVEVLQNDRNRGVAIDLSQAALAQTAFTENRFEEVVARLSPWLTTLSVLLRTPQGASLDPNAKSEFARALKILALSLREIRRADESEENLRLAVQYAHDTPSAAELYKAFAFSLRAAKRFAEAIGPLRRAQVLLPQDPEIPLDLTECFLRCNRTVAALGCLRLAKTKVSETHDQENSEKTKKLLEKITLFQTEIEGILGSAFQRFQEAVSQ